MDTSRGGIPYDVSNFLFFVGAIQTSSNRPTVFEIKIPRIELKMAVKRAFYLNNRPRQKYGECRLLLPFRSQALLRLRKALQSFRTRCH